MSSNDSADSDVEDKNKSSKNIEKKSKVKIKKKIFLKNGFEETCSQKRQHR